MTEQLNYHQNPMVMKKKTKHSNKNTMNVDHETESLPFDFLKEVRNIADKIDRSLINEPWLPLALRSTIAQEMIAIRELIENPYIRITELIDQIGVLVFSLHPYDGLLKKSNTLLQIHVLDLHLRDHLQQLKKNEDNQAFRMNNQPYPKAS